MDMLKLRIKIPHFLLFILMNVFFGTMGVWIPLVSPFFYANGEMVFIKFVEVLESGAAYTFAIAYLTATGAYLFIEYLDRKEQDYKELKIIFGLLALLLVVLCSVFYATQLATPTEAKSAKILGRPEVFQLVFTALSLLTGFALALFEEASSCSLDAVLDNNQATLKKNSKKIMGKVHNKGIK